MANSMMDPRFQERILSKRDEVRAAVMQDSLMSEAVSEAETWVQLREAMKAVETLDIAMHAERDKEGSDYLGATDNSTADSNEDQPRLSGHDGTIQSSLSAVAAVKIYWKRKSNGSCPHDLHQFMTPSPTFQCDACGLSLPQGAVLHGCRLCDFDLCSRCLSGRVEVGRLQFLAMLGSSVPRQWAYQFIFKFWDADEDGIVSVEDLKLSFKQLCLGVSQQDIETLHVHLINLSEGGFVNEMTWTTAVCAADAGLVNYSPNPFSPKLKAMFEIGCVYEGTINFGHGIKPYQLHVLQVETDERGHQRIWIHHTAAHKYTHICCLSREEDAHKFSFFDNHYECYGTVDPAGGTISGHAHNLLSSSTGVFLFEPEPSPSAVFNLSFSGAKGGTWAKLMVARQKRLALLCACALKKSDDLINSHIRSEKMSEHLRSLKLDPEEVFNDARDALNKTIWRMRHQMVVMEKLEFESVEHREKTLARLSWASAHISITKALDLFKLLTLLDSSDDFQAKVADQMFQAQHFTGHCFLRWDKALQRAETRIPVSISVQDTQSAQATSRIPVNSADIALADPQICDHPLQRGSVQEPFRNGKPIVLDLCCLTGEKAYFEVEILTGGDDIRVGFSAEVDDRCQSLPRTQRSCLGGDFESWAVDGSGLAHHRFRMQLQDVSRWQPHLKKEYALVQSSTWGGTWAPGDCVGFACDLELRHILVSVNGSLHVVWNDVQLPPGALGLCPAISFGATLGPTVEGNSRIKMNMGMTPFKHEAPSSEFLPFTECEAFSELRDTEVFMTEVTNTSWASVRSASSRLRADQMFMYESIKSNGLALRFASAELRCSPEFVRNAVNKNGFALRFAESNVRKQRDIVETATLAIQAAARKLAEESASHTMLASTVRLAERMTDALSIEPCSVNAVSYQTDLFEVKFEQSLSIVRTKYFCPTGFCAYAELNVLEAGSYLSVGFSRADTRRKLYQTKDLQSCKDGDIIGLACDLTCAEVEVYINGMRFCAYPLQPVAAAPVVLCAAFVGGTGTRVLCNTGAFPFRFPVPSPKHRPFLYYGSLNDVMDTETILLEAMKQNPLILRHASERLKDDQGFAREVLRQDCSGVALQYFTKRVTTCRDVVLEALLSNPKAMPFASEVRKFPFHPHSVTFQPMTCDPTIAKVCAACGNALHFQRYRCTEGCYWEICSRCWSVLPHEVVRHAIDGDPCSTAAPKQFQRLVQRQTDWTKTETDLRDELQLSIVLRGRGHPKTTRTYFELARHYQTSNRIVDARVCVEMASSSGSFTFENSDALLGWCTTAERHIKLCVEAEDRLRRLMGIVSAGSVSSISPACIEFGPQDMCQQVTSLADFVVRYDIGEEQQRQLHAVGFDIHKVIAFGFSVQDLQEMGMKIRSQHPIFDGVREDQLKDREQLGKPDIALHVLKRDHSVLVDSMFGSDHLPCLQELLGLSAALSLQHYCWEVLFRLAYRQALCRQELSARVCQAGKLESVRSSLSDTEHKLDVAQLFAAGFSQSEISVLLAPECPTPDCGGIEHSGAVASSGNPEDVCLPEAGFPLETVSQRMFRASPQQHQKWISLLAVKAQLDNAGIEGRLSEYFLLRYEQIVRARGQTLGKLEPFVGRDRTISWCSQAPNLKRKSENQREQQSENGPGKEQVDLQLIACRAWLASRTKSSDEEGVKLSAHQGRGSGVAAATAADDRQGEYDGHGQAEGRHAQAHESMQSLGMAPIRCTAKSMSDMGEDELRNHLNHHHLFKNSSDKEKEAIIAGVSEERRAKLKDASDEEEKGVAATVFEGSRAQSSDEEGVKLSAHQGRGSGVAAATAADDRQGEYDEHGQAEGRHAQAHESMQSLGMAPIRCTAKSMSDMGEDELRNHLNHHHLFKNSSDQEKEAIIARVSEEKRSKTFALHGAQAVEAGDTEAMACPVENKCLVDEPTVKDELMRMGFSKQLVEYSMSHEDLGFQNVTELQSDIGLELLDWLSAHQDEAVAMGFDTREHSREARVEAPVVLATASPAIADRAPHSDPFLSRTEIRRPFHGVADADGIDNGMTRGCGESSLTQSNLCSLKVDTLQVHPDSESRFKLVGANKSHSHDIAEKLDPEVALDEVQSFARSVAGESFDDREVKQALEHPLFKNLSQKDKEAIEVTMRRMGQMLNAGKDGAHGGCHSTTFEPDHDHVKRPPEAGTRVRVHGLVRAAEYNGMFGTVKRFDQETQRLEVQLESSKELKIKLNNIEVQEGNSSDMQRPASNCGYGVSVHYGQSQALPVLTSPGSNVIMDSTSKVMVPHLISSYANGDVLPKPLESCPEVTARDFERNAGPRTEGGCWEDFIFSSSRLHRADPTLNPRAEKFHAPRLGNPRFTKRRNLIGCLEFEITSNDDFYGFVWARDGQKVWTLDPNSNAKRYLGATMADIYAIDGPPRVLFEQAEILPLAMIDFLDKMALQSDKHGMFPQESEEKISVWCDGCNKEKLASKLEPAFQCPACGLTVCEPCYDQNCGPLSRKPGVDDAEHVFERKDSSHSRKCHPRPRLERSHQEALLLPEVPTGAVDTTWMPFDIEESWEGMKYLKDMWMQLSETKCQFHGDDLVAEQFWFGDYGISPYRASTLINFRCRRVLIEETLKHLNPDSGRPVLLERLRVVAALADGDADDRACIAALGGVDKLLMVMKIDLSDVDIQLEACRSLQYLTRKEDVELCEQGNGNAMDLTSNIIGGHSNDKTSAHLTRPHHDYNVAGSVAGRLLSLDGLSVLVDCSRAHVTHPMILAGALHVFANLASCRTFDPEACMGIAAAATKSLPQHEAVQSALLEFLHAVVRPVKCEKFSHICFWKNHKGLHAWTFRDYEKSTPISMTQTVVLALEAMLRHLKNARVQHLGTAILRYTQLSGKGREQNQAESRRIAFTSGQKGLESLLEQSYELADTLTDVKDLEDEMQDSDSGRQVLYEVQQADHGRLIDALLMLNQAEDALAVASIGKGKALTYMLETKQGASSTTVETFAPLVSLSRSQLKFISAEGVEVMFWIGSGNLRLSYTATQFALEVSSMSLLTCPDDSVIVSVAGRMAVAPTMIRKEAGGLGQDGRIKISSCPAKITILRKLARLAEKAGVPLRGNWGKSLTTSQEQFDDFRTSRIREEITRMQQAEGCTTVEYYCLPADRVGIWVLDSNGKLLCCKVVQIEQHELLSLDGLIEISRVGMGVRGRQDVMRDACHLQDLNDREQYKEVVERYSIEGSSFSDLIDVYLSIEQGQDVDDVQILGAISALDSNFAWQKECKDARAQMKDVQRWLDGQKTINPSSALTEAIDKVLPRARSWTQLHEWNADVLKRLYDVTDTKASAEILRRVKSCLDEELILKRLHNQLIEPVSEFLPTGQDVLIIPHRHLYVIPWAALQDARGRYLIQHHALRIAPSLRLAASKLAPQARRTARAVVVGNPSPNSVGPLPYAQQEAEHVSSRLQQSEIGKVDIVTGSKATRERVLNLVAGARWVHFACHAKIDENALILAQEKEDLETELLTMELIQDKAHLAPGSTVVLSACNTGRGKISAEGVVGLSRGFLASGAAATVVSLWSVADNSTKSLMQYMYAYLEQNMSLHQAMRFAMLKMAGVRPVQEDEIADAAGDHDDADSRIIADRDSATRSFLNAHGKAEQRALEILFKNGQGFVYCGKCLSVSNGLTSRGMLSTEACQTLFGVSSYPRLFDRHGPVLEKAKSSSSKVVNSALLQIKKSVQIREENRKRMGSDPGHDFMLDRVKGCMSMMEDVLLRKQVEEVNSKLEDTHLLQEDALWQTVRGDVRGRKGCSDERPRVDAARPRHWAAFLVVGAGTRLLQPGCDDEAGSLVQEA